MDNRLELHDILCEIINITESDGDRHTYFQPPASIQLKYPAIVYARKTIDKMYADNSTYKTLDAYDVTLIDKNPDSVYIKKLLELPYCTFDRHYVADNLNHDVFTIYR